MAHLRMTTVPLLQAASTKPSTEQGGNVLRGSTTTNAMPIVGYGTSHMYESEILAALRAGVRHLDCAELYCNQDMVGRALQTFVTERNGVPWDEQELQLTSELTSPNSNDSKPDYANNLKSDGSSIDGIVQEAIASPVKPPTKSAVDKTPLALARLRRSDFFITSKVWCQSLSLSPEDLRKTVQKTIDDLQCGYLDLLLVHWPFVMDASIPFKRAAVFGPLMSFNLSANDTMRWVWVKSLEPLVKTHKCDINSAGKLKPQQPLVRNLGLSNFDQHQIERLLKGSAFDPLPPLSGHEEAGGFKNSKYSRNINAAANEYIRNNHFLHDLPLPLEPITIPPCCNQIECHPGFPQEELVDFLKRVRIQSVAWGPLNWGKIDRNQKLVKVLSEVAEEVGRAQQDMWSARKGEKKNTKKANASASDQNPLSSDFAPTIHSVALRWNVQRGVVVIPASTNPKHVQENLACGIEKGENFTLTPAQISRITSEGNTNSRRFPDLLAIWPTKCGALVWYLSRVIDMAMTMLCVFLLHPVFGNGIGDVLKHRRRLVLWKGMWSGRMGSSADANNLKVRESDGAATQERMQECQAGKGATLVGRVGARRKMLLLKQKEWRSI